MYKRTKYNGDYRDFGIEAVVEGYCLPEKSLFCHFDKHNDYRSGYNVFVGAVLCKSEKVEGEITDVRYLCGGYTRVAAGDYMDRKCIADVAAEEWEKTYSELPKARRDVGPSLLDLRPKKGYAGRQPHANKQAGDYAIYASELGIVFDKFKKKHGYELPLAARLELTYLSVMTNKAMQFCRAMEKVVEEDCSGLEKDACLCIIGCAAYRLIGGNNAGGKYPRTQPSWNYPLRASRMYLSLVCMLEVCKDLDDGVSQNESAKKLHNRCVKKLRHGVFGAGDLPAHKLLAIIVLTGTAGKPLVADEASIAQTTTTGREMGKRYRAITASQAKAVMSVTCKKTNQSPQVVENVFCISFSTGNGKVDTVKAGQSFRVVMGGNIVEYSDDFPSGRVIPERTVPLQLDCSWRSKGRWWDSSHLPELIWGPEACHEYKLGPIGGGKARRDDYEVEDDESGTKVKKNVPKKLKINANSPSKFSPAPPKESKKGKSKKRRKTDPGDRVHYDSRKHEPKILDVHAVCRRTRGGLKVTNDNSSFDGHPSKNEMLLDSFEKIHHIDLHRDASQAIQMELYEGTVDGAIRKKDLKYIQPRKNRWVCTGVYEEVEFGGKNMSSFYFPVGMQGTCSIDGVDNIPVYASKKAARDAALFHVIMTKNNGRSDNAMLDRMKGHYHACFMLNGAELPNIWCIMYLFQGELYVCSGKGREKSARFQLTGAAQPAQESNGNNSVVGKRVAKYFNSGLYFGKVEESWYCADDNDTYWKVVYDDGDVEDNDAESISNMICLYKRVKRQDMQRKVC